MKKQAFSISELLITLAVIAVITVILLPGLVKMTPDKKKMTIINAHSKIVKTVEQILDDDSIYNCPEDSENEGFACQDKPDSVEFNDNIYSGDTKFEQIVAYKLGLKETNDSEDLKWKESNGSTWDFEKKGNNNSAYYIITIDTDGKKGSNKYYGENNTTKPDRFRFKVNNYGGVIGYDAMTEAYLRNSLKLNASEEDEKSAAKIAKTKNYNK